MASSIWNTSLNILARREHSRHELKDKLSQRFEDSDTEIEEALDRLIEVGLQSDARFVRAWFNMQVNKGRGPIRIHYESRQKGINSLIEEVIQESEIDWYEHCKGVAQRKFANGISTEDKAKAYRFLSYRGFSSDSISFAIDQLQY